MRNPPRTRYEPRPGRGPRAPRALFLGVGLFVVTLIVLGAVLFASRGDSPTPTAAAQIATSTPRPSPSAALAATATKPAATRTATQAAATATPEDATATDEPTDTPDESTATPTVEPATDTPEPTDVAPTEAPASGEFGVLPPAEIPSGGLGRDLTLQYDLNVSLDSAPTEASVYELQWPDRTSADVAALAANLGIQGDVADQGGGNYIVDGAGGTLNVAPETVQIGLQHDKASGALEDDATLVDNARSWLLDMGLVTADIGDGSVTGKDTNAQRATVVFTTSEPTPLLAAYPSARVTLGPGGAVFEAYVKWPASYDVATYPLADANTLWAAAQSGQGYIEADLSGVPGDGPVTGTLSVTNLSLAYSTAGSDSAHEFLAPIMVFSGEAQLDGVDMTVPVSIYVPAVAGQAAPRG